MPGIQFNLLPDIKLQADKSRRMRDLVYSGAIAVSAISLAIFLIMLFSVDVVQKKQFNDAGKNLDATNTQLKSISNISQVITVNSQLQTLVSLHQNKHITSRIFTYLSQVTPSAVSIGKLDMDTGANTMNITGNADTQKTVNTFIDTLKLTTFKVSGSDTSHPAFTSVVESGFAINPNNVSYTLNLQFDPQLFANNLLDSSGNAQAPVLTVPKLTSTKAAIDDPTNTLFKAQTGGN